VRPRLAQLILVLAITSSLTAEDQLSNIAVSAADVELRAVGAARYDVVMARQSAQVDLRGHTGNWIGQVDLKQTGPEVWVMRWFSPNEQFDLTWDLGNGLFSIQLSDGRIATKRVDARGAVLEVAPEFDAFLEPRMPQVAAIAMVVEKVRTFEKARKAFTPRTECMFDCQPPSMGDPVYGDPYGPPSYYDPYFGGGGGGGSLYRVVCNGPWVEGSAYGWGFGRRSELCYEAQQDANLKCWNADCTGCCEHLSCDAYCQAGDYFCVVATVTGRACSRAAW
jgi:hypothetical protein